MADIQQNESRQPDTARIQAFGLQFLLDEALHMFIALFNPGIWWMRSTMNRSGSITRRLQINS